MIFTKRYMFAFALVVILMVASVGVAWAADDSINVLPGTGWWTGTGIQNVGTDTATLTISSYSTDPTQPPVTTQAFTIPQDALRNFLPDELGISGQFQGSATVSSNQPLRAIVNTTNRQAAGYGVAGGAAAAQYQGVNAPATEVRFPLAKNNHYDKYTTFFIQNAGDTKVKIEVKFDLGGGSCTITTGDVEPSRMAVVSPNQPGSGCPSGNGTGLGSATATASQPLAGVVLEHGNENPAKLLQATRGFTPSDYDAKAYAPTIKNNYYRRFTGMNVQNVSANPIDVKVTYIGVETQAGFPSCNGKTYTQNKSGLQPGESVTFVTLSSQGSPVPEGCLASATVEATGGQVVAVVNESFLSSVVQGGTRQESTTYSAAPANSATMKIAAPVYKQKSYGKITGLSVQNVGTAAATNVVVKFTGPTGTYTTKPESVAVGGSSKYVEMFKEPGRFAGASIPANIADANGLFSVVVTADQPIVAIANESTYPFVNPPLEQDKNNYEGFNLTP